MGIRFTCHHCSYAMHVKDFQGGKRGKCPHCNKSFRVPLESTDYSIPILDGQSESIADAPARSSAVVAKKAPTAIAVDGKKFGDVAMQEKQAAASSQFKSPTNAGLATKERADKQSAPADKSERANPRTLPHAFALAPNAAWYVRPPSGGQYGPAEQSLLTLWIQENRVTGDSLLWREGQSQWIPSAELLPELYPTESVSKTEDPLNERIDTQPSNNAAAPSFTLASPTLTTSSTSAANLVAQKKLRKRRQQWIAISILAIVSLCLCTGLIVVLFLK